MTKKNDKPDNEAFPEASKDEILAARAEGVTDAIRESTKDGYLRGADQEYGNEPDGPQPPQVDHGVFNMQHLLDLSLDDLKAVLDNDKAGAAIHPGISEGKAAGLLEVERSGKNRTDVVQLLCKHLGIKSPYEVTDAGPAYTNDVSRTVID